MCTPGLEAKGTAPNDYVAVTNRLVTIPVGYSTTSHLDLASQPHVTVQINEDTAMEADE